MMESTKGAAKQGAPRKKKEDEQDVCMDRGDARGARKERD